MAPPRPQIGVPLVGVPLVGIPVVGVRGGLTVDHLVTVGVGASFAQLGGPGLYAALGARAVAGVDVRLSTALPDDDPRFAAVLASAGVDLGCASTLASVPSCWVLTAPEGRRIIPTVATGPTEVELSPAAADLGPDPADVPAAFFVGLAGLLDCAPTVRSPVSPGTRVLVDPHQGPLAVDGIDYLRRVTPAGAVLAPSRVQLRMIDDDPHRAAGQIAAALGCAVIARLDRDGMLVADGAQAWTVHDPAVEVIETTGAGDASAAGILAALTLGADLVTAAMVGMSVARLVLSAPGSDGLLRAVPLTAPFPEIRSTPVRPFEEN